MTALFQNIIKASHGQDMSLSGGKRFEIFNSPKSITTVKSKEGFLFWVKSSLKPKVDSGYPLGYFSLRSACARSNIPLARVLQLRQKTQFSRAKSIYTKM